MGDPSSIRVLVACEKNQFTTIAFRERGFQAYSCDIQPCTGGHPEWHLKCDAAELLKLPRDLLIAHPPCTYLACSGAVNLYDNQHNVKDYERYLKGFEAAEFFNDFLNAGVKHIAVENPKMLTVWGIRKPDQYVEPFEHGHPWRKKTGIWLRNLPKLEPTNVVEPMGLWVGSSSAARLGKQSKTLPLNSQRSQEVRSMTFPGISRAMAKQWGDYILNLEE